MSRITFTGKGGRTKKVTAKNHQKSGRSPEEVVREIKKAGQTTHGEAYRERSLAIHGLVCARCGREFNSLNRHLLTVHHKDGNHLYNPPDGSNWENLCVYCHEDTHARSLLADYLDGTSKGNESHLVYSEKRGEDTNSLLGEKLKLALQNKHIKR